MNKISIQDIVDAGYDTGIISSDVNASFLEYEVVNPDDLMFTETSSKNQFRAESAEYDYKRWLESNYPDLDREETKAFSHALRVNLLGDYANWGEALSDNPDYLYAVAHLFRWLFTQRGSVLAESYGIDNFYHEGWRVLYENIVTAQEVIQGYVNRGAFSQTSLRGNTYRYGHQQTKGGILSIFNDTFNTKPWMWPTGVNLTTGDEGLYDNDKFRQDLFVQTHGAKFWRDMPFTELLVPLPSKYYFEYMQEIDDLESSLGQLSNINLAYSKGVSYRNCVTSNTYRYSYDGGYTQVMFFDYVGEKWLDKPEQDWGRKYRSCTLCNQVHSNHWNVQYRQINEWVRSRGNGDYACFICASLFMTNYNVTDKLFVYNSSIGPEAVDFNRRYEDDEYVNYVHGLDSSNARGSRTYQVDFIDDSNWQAPATMNYQVELSESLPINVRKFMSWTREMFTTKPGSDKTSDVEDLRYTLHANYNESHLASNRAETSYNDPDTGYDITGADQMRMIRQHIPVVRLHEPVSEGVRNVMPFMLSLRVDAAWDSRQYTSSSSRARVRTADENRTADDGWLEPDHGLNGLIEDKQDYNWRPAFYYVHHSNGNWMGVSADTNSREVPHALACPCGNHDGPSTHINSHQWHRHTGLFMGLELELVIRDIRLWENSGFHEMHKRTVHTFHPDGYKPSEPMNVNYPQLLFAKRDGSLPSGTGVEYISQPMTLDAWAQVPEMFWLLVQSNYKAFGLDDVGIHIHIPWDSLTKAHGYAFLSALNIMQLLRNGGLLRHIAQRAHGDWAKWDLLEYRDAHNTVAEVVKQRKATNSEKYKAINLMHTNTIELRYFRSNAMGSRVLKNLQFVDALYRMTLDDVESTDGWDEYRDMPNPELIELVNGYSHQSIKAKLEGIHDDGAPFGLSVERRLANFVEANNDVYGHLDDFIKGDVADSEGSDISVYDIGTYETTEEEPEELIEIDEEGDILARHDVVIQQTSITINGTTYN